MMLNVGWGESILNVVSRRVQLIAPPNPNTHTWQTKNHNIIVKTVIVFTFVFVVHFTPTEMMIIVG